MSIPFRFILFIIATVISLINAQTQPLKVLTRNWLEVSQDSWPPRDPLDQKSNANKQLYVFHQEESGFKETIRFRNDFLGAQNLISKIDVTFRYWTTSNLNLFRAQADNKPLEQYIDVPLNVTRKWTDGLISQISQSELADMKMLNGDGVLNYTTVFKDIQLKYTERVATTYSQWPLSPIHGYKPHEMNVKRVKTSSHLLNVASRHAQIYPQTPITFYADYTENILQFEIFTVPNEKLEKIQIKFNAKQNDCKINPKDKIIKIECEILNLDDIGGDTKQLKSFNVTLDNNEASGFIIINSESISLNRITEMPLHDKIHNSLKTTAPQLSELLTYRQDRVNSDNTSVPYVNIIDSQPDEGDQCYTLVTSHPQTQIEIYLTFRNHKQGKLLTKFIYESPKSFCVNQFIALRHLQKYQLTLVFSQNLANDFTFLLLTQTSRRPMNIKTPWDTNDQEKTQKELTTSWYYYNADWFDFEIHGPENQGEPVKFYACDIVANCFSYDSYINNNSSEHEIHYRLRDEFKTELSQSPFIRIAVAKMPVVQKFDFSYVKSIENDLKLIQGDIQFDSANFTNPETPRLDYKSIIYRPSVRINRTIHETSKSFTFKVPINHIDLRVHRLVISITENLAYEKNKIVLRKLTFEENISETRRPKRHDLSEIFNIKRSVNQAITISTEELFYVESHEVKQKSLSGNFNIELEVMPEKDFATVQIEIKLEDGNLEPQTQDINYMVLPLNLHKTQNQYPTLSATNPKALITTGLVRLKFGELIPSHNISIKFGSDQTLYAEDIKIKKIVTSQTNVNVRTEAKIKIDTNDTISFTDAINYNAPIQQGSGTFELIYIVELINQTKQIWINVEQFYMDDPINIESPKLKLVGPVIATFDERFERFQCPANFRINENLRSCDETHIYQEGVTECSPNLDGSTPGCRNLFVKQFSNASRYFNPNGTESIRYLEYDGDTNPYNKGPSSYLQVNKPLNSHDLCLDFMYRSIDEPLIISADNKSRYRYYMSFPITQNEAFGRICASELIDDVTKLRDIYFRIANWNRQLILENNFIQFIDHSEPKKVHNQISNGINQGEINAEHFFSPEKAMFKFENQTAEFKVTNLQAKTTSKEYSLRTKWIKIPKKNTQILVNFRTEASEGPKNFYKINLILSAPNQQSIGTQKIADFSVTSQPFVTLLNTEQTSEFYQVTVQIQLELSDLILAKDKIDEFTLKLLDFSINDPCVNNQTGVLETCSGNGVCERYDSTPFCKCNDGFTDDQCETVDYCTRLNPVTGKMNNQICTDQQLKCESYEELESFECDCEKDELEWDSITQKCAPKLVTCPPNQTHQLINNQIQCACAKGLIRKENGFCTKYNPCNSEHRQLAGQRVRPCLNSKATCVESKNSILGDYECQCEDGYFNQYGLKTPNANCLQNLCQTCDQTCINSNATAHEFKCICSMGYNLTESGQCIANDKMLKPEQLDQCTPKVTPPDGYPKPYFAEYEKCKCSKGFTFDNQTVSCNVDQSLFRCSKVELKSDKQPGCVCGEGQTFDPVTRKCPAECTAELVQKCTSKNALCKIDYRTGKMSNSAECKCPQDQIAFASNSSLPNEWTCIPKCSLLERPENGHIKCTRQYQHCDAHKMKFDNLLNGHIFVQHNSTIANASAHCQCEVGFEWNVNGNKCELASTPVRYIKDMQFDANLGEEGEGERNHFVDTIEKAFISLIESIFSSQTIPSETKCHLTNNSYTKPVISCSAAFPTKLNSNQIHMKIENTCRWVNVTETVTKCMFVTRENAISRSKRNILTEMGTFDPNQGSGSQSNSFRNILVCDEQAILQVLKVDPVDFCSIPSICRSNYENSLCKPKTISNETLYECICDESLFTVQSTVSLPCNAKHNLQMQSCKLKPMCTEQKDKYGCSDPEAQCHLTVDFTNGTYVPESYCSCPKSGLILTSRNRFCANSCDGYCRNGGVCANDAKDQNKIVCHCVNGFTGDKCDKRVEIHTNNDTTRETSNTDGFKVATIVLSVLLGIAVLGLVVVLIKRYTSFNFIYYITNRFQRNQTEQPRQRHNIPQDIPLERRHASN